VKRVRKTIAFAALAIALVVPLRAVASTRAQDATTQIVTVTIYGHTEPLIPGKILFNPRKVKSGKVIFKITNKDDDEFHIFAINAAQSRRMGPDGGRAILRVAFKKPGLYNANCPDDTLSGIGGQLRVT